MNHQMIFVNLPVADVRASRKFFTAVGYQFNEEFCDDERCLAVVLGENIFAMLLKREFFDTFHEGTSEPGAREVLVALSASSRDEVDALAEKAVDAGGTVVRTQDEGYMYGQSYADLDGHIWEIMWMDVEAAMASDAPADEETQTPATV